MVDTSTPLICDDTDLTPLRRRDTAAFTKLVQAHQDIVAGLCQSMGLSGADMEDAMAEAFAEVYRSLPGFTGRSALTTWVYRIAVRTIWRVRTARDQGKTGELSDHLTQTLADSAAPIPSKAAEENETAQRIWGAVAQLNPRQATAVELYYRRDMSLADIAEVLECPVGTVKTLLFRAREALRTALQFEELPR